MTTAQARNTLEDTRTRALVFACRWCSLLGAERAGRERRELPADFRLIPVECAGAVALDLVLRAFAEGAHGIAVMGCHLGGCRHNESNRNAHARLEMLASALTAVGMRRERLLLSWGTAHEAGQFAAQISNFMRGLERLRHEEDLSLLRGTFPLQNLPAQETRS
jgi:coenzyme F420-reducing hydrogenase delta subunit